MHIWFGGVAGRSRWSLQEVLETYSALQRDSQQLPGGMLQGTPPAEAALPRMEQGTSHEAGADKNKPGSGPQPAAEYQKAIEHTDDPPPDVEGVHQATEEHSAEQDSADEGTSSRDQHD